jgi:tetratricopeptide (TPR) repeat protein
MKQSLFFLLLFFVIPVNIIAQGSELYFKNIEIADSLLSVKKYKEASDYYSKAFKLNNNRALVDHRYSAAQTWAMQSNLDSAFYNLFKLTKFRTKYTVDVLNSDMHFNILKKDARWDSVIKWTAYVNRKFNSSLSKKLDSVYYSDLKVRSDFFLMRDKYPINSIEYNSFLSKMKEADSLNLVIVLDIINKYGWLGEEVVGINGNTALFLVIQHSNLDVQEKMLPILKAAVLDKRARSNDLALLEDRISVAKTGKQIYGSQYYEKNSVKTLYPIIDPLNVNKRRHAVGLGTIEEYLKLIDVESYKLD